MDRFFIPLKSESETLVLINDYQNNMIIDEGTEFDIFEKTHVEISSNVNLNGILYKDTKVLKPKNPDFDWYYVEVDENLIPISIKQVESELDVDETYFSDELSKVIKSEYYYYDQYSNYDIHYLNPYIQIDGGDSVQFNDYGILIRQSKLLIIGGPGTGKTSLLKKFSFEMLRKIRRGKTDLSIPIYLRLRDLNFSSSFELKDMLNEHKNLINSKFGTVAMKENRLIYLFDGLDELEKKNRNKFVSFLDKMDSYERNFRIIVTTRAIKELEDNSFFDGFSRIKLQPFKSSQITSYICRKIGEKKDQEKLSSIINYNKDLSSLLSNPLLLSISIAYYKSKNILPSNIPNLVEELVWHLLEKWDSSRFIDRCQNIDIRDTKNILGNISYHLFCDKKIIFDKYYVKRFLQKKYSKIDLEELLNEIKENTNLIYNNGDEWSFSHVLFADFFCANFLIEKSRGIDQEYQKHKHKVKWNKVWDNAIYQSSDPEFYADELKKAYNYNDALINITRSLRILIEARYSDENVEKNLKKLFKHSSKRLNDLLEIAFFSEANFQLKIEILEEVNPKLIQDFINLLIVFGNNKNTHLLNFFELTSEDGLSKLLLLLAKNQYYAVPTNSLTVEFDKIEE